MRTYWNKSCFASEVAVVFVHSLADTVKSVKHKRPVVFFQHGLLSSSADWVMNTLNGSAGKHCQMTFGCFDHMNAIQFGSKSVSKQMSIYGR